MTTTTVSIKTKPQIYGMLAFCANKPQNALAEYVDNSISSFEKHKDVLEQINEGGKVRIDIEIYEDRIVVTDNAFGIEEAEYERAFELATPPADATGLNEFGMGMKISSIWLSRHWEVESKAYGESVRKKFVFDQDEVIDQSKTDLAVNVEEAPADEHYTRITLTRLTKNRPRHKGVALDDLRTRLASIYSRKINGGVADIFVNGEQLTYKPLTPLVASYAKKKSESEEPIEWRKDFDMNFGPYGTIRGFIGVLAKMSEKDSGFLLFRRGRAIGTSGADKFRPKELCGNVGSPQYKRIFGEIDIEGFRVSFSKDQFIGDEDFDNLIVMLAKHIKEKGANDPTWDILGQASEYREKENEEKRRKKIKENITEVLKAKKEEPAQTASSDPTLQAEAAAPAWETYQTKVPASEKGDYTLRISFNENDESNKLFDIACDDKKMEVDLVFYLKHVFFSRYQKLSDMDSMAPVIDIFKAMMVGQIKLIEGGEYKAADQFFKDVSRLVCIMGI